jgi:hypothetical protein
MSSFLMALCFLCIPLAQAEPLVLVSGEASFTATGKPSLIEIKGTGAKLIPLNTSLTRNGTSITGTAMVDLSTLTTGMELRDSHLKDKYLETSEHPWAAITALVADTSTGEFKGDLTIKGQGRPVKGTFKLDGKQLTSSFKILLTDYPSIGVPSWLGVTVAEEVQIEVKCTLQ